MLLKIAKISSAPDNVAIEDAHYEPLPGQPGILVYCLTDKVADNQVTIAHEVLRHSNLVGTGRGQATFHQVPPQPVGKRPLIVCRYEEDGGSLSTEETLPVRSAVFHSHRPGNRGMALHTFQDSLAQPPSKAG